MSHLRPVPGSENTPVLCWQCDGIMVMEHASGSWMCTGRCGVAITRNCCEMIYGGTPSEISRGFYSTRKIIPARPVPNNPMKCMHMKPCDNPEDCKLVVSRPACPHCGSRHTQAHPGMENEEEGCPKWACVDCHKDFWLTEHGPLSDEVCAKLIHLSLGWRTMMKTTQLKGHGEVNIAMYILEGVPHQILWKNDTSREWHGVSGNHCRILVCTPILSHSDNDDDA